MWQVLTLLSAFFKASQDVSFKKVLGKEHATVALVSVTLLYTLFLMPSLPFIKWNYGPDIYLIIILRVVIFCIADILFYKALRHSDISIVAPFYNLSPFFLIIISYLFLGEVLTYLELAGIFLLVIGSFLIKNESTSFKDHQGFLKSKYFYFVISALFLWSLSATLGKYVAPKMRALDLQVMTAIFASIILLLYFSLRYQGILEVISNIKKDWKFLSIASLSNIGFAFLYYFVLSLPDTKVSLVVPLLRFSVFLDIIIGGTFFHEQHLMKKVSASAVMLAGTIILLI